MLCVGMALKQRFIKEGKIMKKRYTACNRQTPITCHQALVLEI